MTTFNDIWDARPAAPTAEMPVEVTVVGRRCVYVNSRRIAGGKPYVSEGLPFHDLTTTLGEVLDAFPEADILAALAEKRARTDYITSWHAARHAADFLIGLGHASKAREPTANDPTRNSHLDDELDGETAA